MLFEFCVEWFVVVGVEVDDCGFGYEVGDGGVVLCEVLIVDDEIGFDGDDCFEVWFCV